jgi:exopolysaccharide biosynthesis WecB/TagA/CpsF family protein
MRRNHRGMEGIRPAVAGQTIDSPASGIMNTNTRFIFSVPVAVLQRRQAVEVLQARLLSRTPTRLAFANANLLNMAYASPDFRDLLRNFLVLNDGLGVNIASRVLYGSPFPENLNGTDFCPEFLDACSVPLRIYLLGSRPAVVSRAADAIAARWPRHAVVGSQHGYFSPADFARIKERISLLRPDVVLVAMGNGRQERIVDELVSSCTPIAFGVGALFDFLTGEITRAPAWVQAIGAEWLFRLYLEPRRLWRRYVVGNPLFLWRVVVQRASKPVGPDSAI